MELEWVWGLFQPGFVRWASPASQNHFNHCVRVYAYVCLSPFLYRSWSLVDTSASVNSYRWNVGDWCTGECWWWSFCVGEIVSFECTLESLRRVIVYRRNVWDMYWRELMIKVLRWWDWVSRGIILCVSLYVYYCIYGLFSLLYLIWINFVYWLRVIT